eukprot:TRINITY_DN5486_c0_g1_i1.p1 TRINITY_DN5486_c0_g1~~TRINITY_DN5486_c0_g1_i1.p1  ORF type:complete len:134 (+),score=8.65 TRINITY_DN5486_c0_g1_i1:91-492(+)
MQNKEYYIPALLKCNYGNYVLQSFLSKCADPEVKLWLIDSITTHLYLLRPQIKNKWEQLLQCDLKAMRLAGALEANKRYHPEVHKSTESPSQLAIEPLTQSQTLNQTQKSIQETTIKGKKKRIKYKQQQLVQG